MPEQSAKVRPEAAYMMVDPGHARSLPAREGPSESGPLIFTSRERLEAYARTAEIAEYTVIEVPGTVLARMRGKPHWIDGERQG